MNERRLESIQKISHQQPNGVQDLMGLALAEILTLTESPLGYWGRRDFSSGAFVGDSCSDGTIQVVGLSGSEIRKVTIINGYFKS